MANNALEVGQYNNEAPLPSEKPVVTKPTTSYDPKTSIYTDSNGGKSSMTTDEYTAFNARQNGSSTPVTIPRVTPPTPSPTGEASGIKSNVYNADGSTTVTYKDGSTNKIPASGSSSSGYKPPTNPFDPNNLNGTSATDYLAGGSFTPPKTEDQNYKDLLDKASGLINGINSSANAQLDKANAASAARTNAGGLAGSTAGGEITTEAQKPILAEREKALGEVYANIVANAKALTLSQKTQATTDAKEAVAYKEKLREQGIQNISALAANHIDWNKYQQENPENYNALVASIGGDPNVADAMFAMSVPAPEIVSTWNTSDGSGGTVVWQQRVDPVTKQPSIVKYDIPGVPINQNWTSDKLGTNAQIFKAPNFNPADPSTYMIVSTDPTNGGAITVTKNGITTVNGIAVNDTPGTNTDSTIAGAAVNVASIIGLEDPALPLASVIGDINIGIEGIVAGIIKNEGGSPKGVVNNPGNIKFVGLPGQKNSGVKATDGGTFASYDTPGAGKQAIADLVNKGANAGKSFDEFVNAYTGTTGANTESSSDGSPSGSGSILNQTGLSLPAFKYLTEGTSSMTRMNANQRKIIQKEAEDFLNNNGIDISTFQSQYKAYNEALAKNISIFNNTRRAETELIGTIDNLSKAGDEAELKNVKVKNVIKILAGEQVNDPTAIKYATHLNQIISEFAQYNAALEGKNGAELTDVQHATDVVKNGISSTGLKGFEEAIKASTEKMDKVLKGNIDNTRKQVWELFGIGDSFKNAPADKQTVSTAPVDTVGSLDNGTQVQKVGDGKWLDANGHVYDDNGDLVSYNTSNIDSKITDFLKSEGIDINTLAPNQIKQLQDNFA